MIHNTRQIGVRESDPSVRLIAQDFTRTRVSVYPKEEARLRAQVRVPPSIQDQAGDVALWFETRPAEDHSQLLANASFKVRKGVENLPSNSWPPTLRLVNRA